MAKTTPDETPPVEATAQPADVEPDNVGYCHNPDCQVNSMQLWHPVTTEVEPQPDWSGPHQCSDLGHPHAVMCQCGHLLEPEPVNA